MKIEQPKDYVMDDEARPPPGTGIVLAFIGSILFFVGLGLGYMMGG